MGKITAQSPDVILVSHQLTGLDFLDQLRASGCDSGVVMVVAPENLEAGARSLEMGAQDFLIHPLGNKTPYFLSLAYFLS